jgi:hypothetical protein
VRGLVRGDVISEDVHMNTLDTVAIAAATLAIVNGSVALMKHPALGSFWRDALPWYGRLAFFVVVALVSTIAQGLVSGASVGVAIVLGLGAVGTAVMGHEFKGMITEAIEERKQEREAQLKDDAT